MINITVKGWDITVDISWAIQKSLHQSTQLVRGKAIQNAPVMTWTLRRSITTEVMTKEATVWTNVKYAKVREYKNKKNPQRRFYMKRALQSSLIKIQSFFDTNISNLFR